MRNDVFLEAGANPANAQLISPFVVADTIALLPSRQSVSLLTEAVILRRRGASKDALAVLDPENPALAMLDAGLAAVERGRNLELLGRLDDAWLAYTDANEIARGRSVFVELLVDIAGLAADVGRGVTNAARLPGGAPA